MVVSKYVHAGHTGFNTFLSHDKIRYRFLNSALETLETEASALVYSSQCLKQHSIRVVLYSDL